MSLSNLDIAKIQILYPDLVGDDGSFTYLELADAMGMDKGTPHMTRADYQRYYDGRPDLHKHYGKNYLQKIGGEKEKIAKEINEGAAKEAI